MTEWYWEITVYFQWTNEGIEHAQDTSFPWSGLRKLPWVKRRGTRQNVIERQVALLGSIGLLWGYPEDWGQNWKKLSIIFSGKLFPQAFNAQGNARVNLERSIRNQTAFIFLYGGKTINPSLNFKIEFGIGQFLVFNLKGGRSTWVRQLVFQSHCRVLSCDLLMAVPWDHSWGRTCDAPCRRSNTQ